MKIIFFLVLTALIVCQDYTNVEKKKNLRNDFLKDMAKCILKNESTTEGVKKKIERYKKTNNINDFIFFTLSSLEPKTKAIITDCRKEYFNSIRKISYSLNLTNPFKVNMPKKNP